MRLCCCLALSLTVVVACGDDSPSDPDATADIDATAAGPDAAPVPDATPAPPDAIEDRPALACLGDPAPATAPATIRIEGNLFDGAADPIAPLPGASAELRARSDDALIAAVTTGGDGAFAFDVSTGGAPVDAYLAFAVDGYLPTRMTPPHAFAADVHAPSAVVTAAGLDAWHAQLGVTRDSERGTVLAFVWDCDENGIRGSAVATSPAGDATAHWDDDAQHWDPSPDAESNGFALTVNVPAGAVTVTAAYADATLPAATIESRPGELAIAIVDPLE
jgi:hypothetical protein